MRLETWNARANAVLDSVGSVGVLIHNADAASGQGDYEGSIAEPVELTPER